MCEMTELRDALKLSLTSEILASGGRARLRAFGSSMLPTLWPGDILTIESAPLQTLAPGDIVLASRGQSCFVHRVVEKIDCGGLFRWVTRGDAMPQSDPPVAASDLLGRVSLIQRQHRIIIPNRRLSPVVRLLAWMLCHWDGLRRVSLRMYSLRQSPDPQVCGVIS